MAAPQLSTALNEGWPKLASLGFCCRTTREIRQGRYTGRETTRGSCTQTCLTVVEVENFRLVTLWKGFLNQAFGELGLNAAPPRVLNV